MTEPVLIGCSHGTSDPEGRAVIRAILDGVREVRPDLDVREAFVDVQEPAVADVVSEVVMPDGGGSRDAVVVPLLLSGGFHVNVDVAESVADRGGAAGRAAAATALGPDERLIEIAADRLRDAGVRPDDAVVVAAAGSSRPEAARDVEHVVAGLRALHPGPVTVGFGAMAQPSVADAVVSARENAPRVVVLAFLLAPGYFYDRVREAGADVVTRPLGPDPRLVHIVLDRYAEAAGRLSDPPRST